jgi:hypothetical protein
LSPISLSTEELLRRSADRRVATSVAGANLTAVLITTRDSRQHSAATRSVTVTPAVN